MNWHFRPNVYRREKECCVTPAGRDCLNPRAPPAGRRQRPKKEWIDQPILSDPEYVELLCEFTLFVVIGIYDPAKHVLRFAGSADEALHDAEQ